MEQEICFPNKNRALVVTVPGDQHDFRIMNALGIDRPNGVIALVGGAGGLDDFDLERVRPLFTDAVAAAAAVAGALVVDGGTETGISKLMGEARALSAQRFPLVGVVPGALAVLPGEHPKRADAYRLEPNHSHFVLVPGTEWGDESAWIDRIAGEHAPSVPAVTLLVNGGEISRRDVEYSLRAKRPVVIVAGTGRMADRLARTAAPSPLIEIVHLEKGPAALRAVLISLIEGGDDGQVR